MELRLPDLNDPDPSGRSDTRLWNTQRFFPPNNFCLSGKFCHRSALTRKSYHKNVLPSTTFCLLAAHLWQFLQTLAWPGGGDSGDIRWKHFRGGSFWKAGKSLKKRNKDPAPGYRGQKLRMGNGRQRLSASGGLFQAVELRNRSSALAPATRASVSASLAAMHTMRPRIPGAAALGGDAHHQFHGVVVPGDALGIGHDYHAAALDERLLTLLSRGDGHGCRWSRRSYLPVQHALMYASST